MCHKGLIGMLTGVNLKGDKRAIIIWPWSSGQRAHPLLRWSEFESRIQFFYKMLFERNENKQKEAIDLFLKVLFVKLIQNGKFITPTLYISNNWLLQFKNLLGVHFLGAGGGGEENNHEYLIMHQQVRNVILRLVTSSCSCQTARWRPACCWLGWGYMSIGDPSKSH